MLIKYQISSGTISDAAHTFEIRFFPNYTMTENDWSSQGHDTTSVGICWALFMIGLHDEFRQTIFHRMTETFGNDTRRIATFHDLNGMKYLKRISKVSLRIYFPVPSISRNMLLSLRLRTGIPARESIWSECEFSVSILRLFCLTELKMTSAVFFGGYKIPKEFIQKTLTHELWFFFFSRFAFDPIQNFKGAEKLFLIDS